MAKSKQTYEVAQDGFLFGDFYKAGDRVELYPEQAQYDLPPHGSMLKDLVTSAPWPVVKKKPAQE